MFVVVTRRRRRLRRLGSLIVTLGGLEFSIPFRSDGSFSEYVSLVYRRWPVDLRGLRVCTSTVGEQVDLLGRGSFGSDLPLYTRWVDRGPRRPHGVDKTSDEIGSWRSETWPSFGCRRRKVLSFFKIRVGRGCILRINFRTLTHQVWFTLIFYEVL